jgi:adenylate cyclase
MQTKINPRCNIIDVWAICLNADKMTRASKLVPLMMALLVILGLLVLRGLDPAYMQAQRAAGFDTLQRLWPRQMDSPQPVRIVDIDEKSLRELGQWPWSRNRLAALTTVLTEMGAAAIAFDIVFPEADRLSPRRLAEDPAYVQLSEKLNELPDTDEIFARAIASAPAVLAFAAGEQRLATSLPLKSGIAQTGQPTISAAPHISKIAGNISILETAATGLGNINLDLGNEQGVARAIPMLSSDGDRLLPSLSVEALRVAQGAEALVVHGNAEVENDIEGLSIGALEIPVSERGLFQMHFRKNDTALYVSAADVLKPELRETLLSKIEGHIVLIGTSAVGLLDARATSLGETVPGVSIHAQAIEQMLSGRFLSRPDWVAGAEILAGLILALATASLATFARPAKALGFTVLSALVIFTATGFAFNRLGMLVDASFPIFLLIGSFVASFAWRLFVTDRQGRMMRGAFGHYVSPSVLDEIEKHPENLKLGGEVRDITVLFLDIANFTPLSEKLKPDELVSVVNGLWDHCSKAILAEQGTIDKFIGDAIMAFWNAPLPCEAHQSRACRAALAIRDAVRAYNHEQPVREKLEAIAAWPLGIRIGIATGPACVGNMGSSDRFDYSVIGETVNTAARAEAACKHVEHDIVVAGPISGETSNLATLAAGHVNLKGRSARQPITAIVGNEDMAKSETFKALQNDLAYLAKPTRKASTKTQLLSELALHHPVAARFLEALPKRSADYKT